MLARPCRAGVVTQACQANLRPPFSCCRFKGAATAVSQVSLSAMPCVGGESCSLPLAGSHCEFFLHGSAISEII